MTYRPVGIRQSLGLHPGLPAMLQIPLRLKLIARSRRGRSAAPQCLDDGLQPGSDFVRQLAKFDVPHQITGISNGDSCRPVEVLEARHCTVAGERLRGRSLGPGAPAPGCTHPGS